MSSVMSITEFRKKIFDVADWVLKTGYPVDVQRNGQTIFRVTAVDGDSPQERAKYLLEHVLPKARGMWKDIPQKEFDTVNKFMRGPKEKAYWNRKRFTW